MIIVHWKLWVRHWLWWDEASLLRHGSLRRNIPYVIQTVNLTWFESIDPCQESFTEVDVCCLYATNTVCTQPLLLLILIKFKLLPLFSAPSWIERCSIHVCTVRRSGSEWDIYKTYIRFLHIHIAIYVPSLVEIAPGVPELCSNIHTHIHPFL
jgi:hypothetical protein